LRGYGFCARTRLRSPYCRDEWSRWRTAKEAFYFSYDQDDTIVIADYPDSASAPAMSLVGNSLFAALDVLEGRVIGQCMARHRHQEFIRFLNKIDRETPAGRELRLIVDNYATHRHPKGLPRAKAGVRAWLERHKRFNFHFTPSSVSWLNAVEGFFAKLTRQRLKRGVFKGIVDLRAAVNRYLAESNADLKSFTWTADPDGIIENVRRGKQVFESIH